ncbi:MULTISPECIES: hypothetical protein [Streptomyces]|uniref:hypothetical protein n=1 Tax=Streptomyces TaxID=1883 RepID=UPI0009C78918|nr:hypothetical protein [Streptomyces sp. WAC00263]KAF5998473.1 hypothetical protein BOG92_048405 [Streptomyces sp. WAC00263]
MLAKIAVRARALRGRIGRMSTRFDIGWIAGVAIRALCVMTRVEAGDGLVDAVVALLLPSVQDGLIMLVRYLVRAGKSPRARAKRPRSNARRLRRRRHPSQSDPKR